MLTKTKPIISVQVAAETRAELSRLAQQGDRTLSAEIRRAIHEHLERSRGNERD